MTVQNIAEKNATDKMTEKRLEQELELVTSKTSEISNVVLLGARFLDMLASTDDGFAGDYVLAKMLEKANDDLYDITRTLSFLSEQIVPLKEDLLGIHREEKKEFAATIMNEVNALQELAGLSYQATHNAIPLDTAALNTSLVNTIKTLMATAYLMLGIARIVPPTPGSAATLPSQH